MARDVFVLFLMLISGSPLHYLGVLIVTCLYCQYRKSYSKKYITYFIITHFIRINITATATLKRYCISPCNRIENCAKILHVGKLYGPNNLTNAHDVTEKTLFSNARVTFVFSLSIFLSVILLFTNFIYVSLISIRPLATCAISSTYQCSQRLPNFFSLAKVCNARAPYHYCYKKFTKIGSPSRALSYPLVIVTVSFHNELFFVM